jgi:hypothetical protein
VTGETSITHISSKNKLSLRCGTELYTTQRKENGICSFISSTQGQQHWIPDESYQVTSLGIHGWNVRQIKRVVKFTIEAGINFVSFMQILLEDITCVHYGYVHMDVVEKWKNILPLIEIEPQFLGC